jgi:hypothetical protein
MALERQQNPFDTPVPGQSLTDTPKNYSWENPPMFSKKEDAANFIWKRLHRKQTLAKIILMLETGMSVESITRVIVFSGFMEGAFSVDLGLVISPIVEKMILAIGKASGVEKIKLSKPKAKETKQILKNLYKTRNFAKDIQDKEKSKKQEEEVSEKESNGLMAKKGDE